MKAWSFLRKPRFSLRKPRFSKKKLGWGLIGIAISIVIYLLGILPAIEATKKAEDEIVLKKKVLLKYEEYLRNRRTIEEELDRAAKQSEGIQQRLLAGESPQLGAANLQEIVKRFSEKNGISIRSFRILEPKEIDSFRKVSLQIDFNPTNSMLSLGQFMHDIEHHEKELMISEMDLLTPNVRTPSNVQGSMVISGLMKGTKTKEKGRKG